MARPYAGIADLGAEAFDRNSEGDKLLLMWPGLDRCAAIGFRCIVDVVDDAGR